MKVIKRTTRTRSRTRSRMRSRTRTRTSTEKWCKKNISTVRGLAIVFCTINGFKLGNEVLWSIKQIGSHSFSNDDMKVPTMIIVGTQKGGTEALQTYLSWHPDIVGSKKKEPHWFDLHFSPHEFPDGRIPKRDRHEYLTGYRNHAFNMTYMESHLNKKSFEKTASYMFNPKAVNRIKSIVPHAKIIMLLRDPVERAYSHYKMSKWRYTRTKIKTFEDCIELDIKLLKWAGVIPKDENNTLRSLTKEDLDHLDKAWIKYAKMSQIMWARCGTIVGRGIYAAQLSLWWKVYNEDERKNQFLVMRSEDLRPDADGHVHLKNITEFIGVSDRSIESPREIHKTDDIGPMRKETKVRLRRLYLPFNDALDDFLGSSWHDPWLWHE